MDIRNFTKGAVFCASILGLTSSTLAADADSTLRQLAEARGRFVGSILNSNWFSYSLGDDAAIYESTHKSQFNIVVAENEMKFDATEPSRNSFNFNKGDKMMAYAAENGMQVRGHALAWHSQVPQWVPDLAKKVDDAGGSARDTLLAVLKNHIDNVVGHYKGKIREWDVVNEAIDGQPAAWRGAESSVWYKYIGRDFIDSAFVWAHKADPDAKLYYNDYSLEWGLGAGAKAQFAVDSVAKRMKDAGIYITGIGTQTHIANYHETTPQNVRALAQALDSLGLTLQITELDIGYDNGKIVTAEDEAAQGHLFRQFMDVFLEAPNMEAFVIWGFCDKYSWLADLYKFNGLIYDSSFTAKPAYDSLVASLKAHSKADVKPASESTPLVWELESEFGNESFVIVDYSKAGADTRGSWSSDVTSGEPSFIGEELYGKTGYMNVPLAGCDQSKDYCGYQHAIYTLPEDAIEAGVMSKCEALVFTMYGNNSSTNVNIGFNEPWGNLQYGVSVGDKAWRETAVDLKAVRDSAANPEQITFNSESSGFYLAKIEAVGCPDPSKPTTPDTSKTQVPDTSTTTAPDTSDVKKDTSVTIASKYPAQTKAFVTLKNRALSISGLSEGKLSLFDIQGHPIIKNEPVHKSFDLSKIKSGNYIVRIKANTAVYAKQIQIK